MTVSAVLSVQAIYRISPARKSEVRPDWFSQRACLRSFMHAADAARDAGIPLRSTVIVDGDLDSELYAELGWFDTIDSIRLLGNARAFRHAFEVATRGEEDITLFAEDDYMWNEDAIVKTVRVIAELPSAEYASPYAHPLADEDWRAEHRGRPSITATVGDTAWRTTPQTTMTFASRTSVLRARRHYWWLASYGKSPKDGYAFRALIDGHWFNLVGNAAFRDVRRVLNLRTVRLVAECTARRLAPARRPLLLQPVEGLATHVHQPFITGSPDWRAMSISLGESAT